MQLDLSGFIDVKIAVLLWVIGYLIKHVKTPPIERISNRLIPVILMIVGIMVSCITRMDVTLDNILVGIITSLFAVGVHSSGANIFAGLKLDTGKPIKANEDMITNDESVSEDGDDEHGVG